LNAHRQVEDVLSMERELDKTFPPDQKFSYETRNQLTIRTYSQEYSTAYHNMMKGMVEEQMRQSMKHIADLWYTCWVNAGKPDLEDVKEEKVEIKEEEIKEGKVKSREHAKTGLDLFD